LFRGVLLRDWIGRKFFGRLSVRPMLDLYAAWKGGAKRSDVEAVKHVMKSTLHLAVARPLERSALRDRHCQRCRAGSLASPESVPLAPCCGTIL
jgi:hypothetical protein